MIGNHIDRQRRHPQKQHRHGGFLPVEPVHHLSAQAEKYQISQIADHDDHRQAGGVQSKMLLEHRSENPSQGIAHSQTRHQNHKTGCRPQLPDSPVFHAVPPMFQSVSRLRT